MTLKTSLTIAMAALFSSLCAMAQDAPAKPQITMGNGEANAITVEGLSRDDTQTTFAEVRIDGGTVKSFRGTSTAISFPDVTIEKAGWIVLHPVIDGRPDGDMVSGFTYLEAGESENVSIQIDHPADAGDKFLVMLHSDVNEDRVFDFVFVEDGINVEDTAVFEGTHMIAHMITVPE